MKPTIPREIINPCGGFEEDDWLAHCGRRTAGDEFRDTCYFEIVEVSDKPAFEALSIELFHGFCSVFPTRQIMSSHNFFHLKLSFNT